MGEQGEKREDEGLLDRIARLEREVARLARLGSRPVTVQTLQVQALHVDTLHLDQPVYRLDSLSVKELSGSLNLGNNFASVPTVRQSPGATEKPVAGTPNSNETAEQGGKEPNRVPTGRKAARVLKRSGPGVRYAIEEEG
ncbi:hypothetical protein [Gorillibacterium sp. sgz500922]|uniref:hypothetical protein n=1 Tax=Gorillibacterium sp. sgz500922 TaxID=3446694 RepID=UPI003F680D58